MAQQINIARAATEVQEEDEDDPNPTVPEELGYDELKSLIAKHDHWLDKRLKRHCNDVAAVEAKKVIVEQHTIELNELQEKAATTALQIDGYKSTSAELTQRQAESRSTSGQGRVNPALCSGHARRDTVRRKMRGGRDHRHPHFRPPTARGAVLVGEACGRHRRVAVATSRRS